MRRLLVAFFVVAVAFFGFVLPAGASTPTSVTVSVIPLQGAALTYGSGTFFSGTVLGGDGTMSGTVTASENGTELAGRFVAPDGSYHFTLPLMSAGTHSILVSYTGDANFAASSTTTPIVVAKSDSTTSASGPASVFVGGTANYTVTIGLTPAPHDPGVATGTVTAHGPTGPAYGSAPVVNSTAQISVPASAAGSPVIFDYSGDSNLNASSVQKSLTGPNKYGLKMTVLDMHGCTSDQLSPQNCVTPVPGYPMVLGAFFSLAPGTPNPPDTIIPTGTVTFTDVTTNTVLGTSSISTDGLAAIFAAFATPGSHGVKATYNGDAAFAGATSGTLAVNVLDADQIERYVNWVYLDLLGRDGDPGGIAFWTNQIASGTSRAATSWALVNSTEFRSNQISGMYQQFLDRGTDTAGLNYWVGQVGAGMTFEQFQSLLIGSDEYFNMSAKGNGDNTTFVQSMYQDVLNRPIDPTGQAYFVGLLNQGVSRARVVGAIVYSAEHLSTTVDGYYLWFLGRHSDPGGNQYWTTQLQQGARDELIIALIIGSDEYFFST